MNASQGIREMVDKEIMVTTMQGPMNLGQTQWTTKDNTVLLWVAWRAMEVVMAMVMVEERLQWMENGKANYTQRVSNFA
jgi:hypothetical protein